MFDFYYQQGNSRRKLYRASGSRCTVGSARANDLVLSTRHIAKRHAEWHLKPAGLFIEDLGSLSGTWVNRERVQAYGPLSELDEITIGDVSCWLDKAPIFSNATAVAGERIPGVASVEGATFAGSGGDELDLSISTAQHSRDEQPNPVESLVARDENLIYWSRIVHEQLLSQMDLRRKDVSRMSDSELREESAELITTIIQSMIEQFPESLDLVRLKQSVLNESVGLGPLEQFLVDDSVTEVMVNNHREIFVEKSGRLTRSDYQFSSDKAVYAVIERIITPIGRRIDESSPIVDARLKDGSRVNAVIPPLALKGPSLTIRKFPKRRLTFVDLTQAGSIDQRMVDFLKVSVEMRKNIVVSGGTGSGKTTLLNVLSNFIPATDRVVTIEDAAELKLIQPNLVALEARPPNLEGNGHVSIRELVKNALRMRPDRIVVGECRGGEALDMLQAMNTGHDGSLTTIHANNPRDVISRLEVLVLMAGMELPVAAIREQIASAVDLIIQQTRYPCGSRKITKVTEVVGVESGTVQLQDIFSYRQEGLNTDGSVRGNFQASGSIPTFYEELRRIGVEVDLSCFDNQRRQIP